MDLVKKVKENIKKFSLFKKDEKLILAVSGGVDSVVLLDILSQLLAQRSLGEVGFPVVAHLNHNLRGKDSDQDQKFVKELAKKYGLKFETKKINVKKIAQRKKANLEETARKERYKFLAEVAKKYKARKIVTAHHADDQVETVLLNYLRGTGPKGLSGMKFRTSNQTSDIKHQTIIIRPFLNIWRKEIEGYQQENNLQFRQDKSNFDTRIKRNYLRLKTIPQIEKKDKNFKRIIWNKAEKLRELISYLEPKIEEVYKKIKKKEFPNAVVLNLPKFRQLKDNLLVEILKKALSFLQKDLKNISKKHIMSVLEVLKKGSAGKIIVLPCRLRVIVDYDILVIHKGPFKKLKVQKRKLKTGDNLISECGLMIKLEKSKRECKDGFSFDSEKIDYPLYVRSFAPAGTFKPKDFKGTKKLQDLFVDLKIPKRLRTLLPIITDKKGGILGVLGIRQGSIAQFDSNTKKFLSINFEEF